MKTFKKIITVILLLVVNYGVAQNDNFPKKLDSLFSQYPVTSKYTILIELDKTEYSLYENIYITFRTDFEEDSLWHPKFEGLQYINGPKTSSSRSMRNGMTEYNKSWSYTLKPNNIGEYLIESPIFFIGGEKLKKYGQIIVLNTTLTKKQESEVEFKKFRESVFKLEGTYRYIVGDKFGYIEVRQGAMEWIFYRKLTSKEVKLIKKIK
jgi:hypothetical protein